MTSDGAAPSTRGSSTSSTSPRSRSVIRPTSSHQEPPRNSTTPATTGNGTRQLIELTDSSDEEEQVSAPSIAASSHGIRSSSDSLPDIPGTQSGQAVAKNQDERRHESSARRRRLFPAAPPPSSGSPGAPGPSASSSRPPITPSPPPLQEESSSAAQQIIDLTLDDDEAEDHTYAFEAILNTQIKEEPAPSQTSNSARRKARPSVLSKTDEEKAARDDRILSQISKSNEKPAVPASYRRQHALARRSDSSASPTPAGAFNAPHATSAGASHTAREASIASASRSPPQSSASSAQYPGGHLPTIVDENPHDPYEFLPQVSSTSTSSHLSQQQDLASTSAPAAGSVVVQRTVVHLPHVSLLSDAAATTVPVSASSIQPSASYLSTTINGRDHRDSDSEIPTFDAISGDYSEDADLEDSEVDELEDGEDQEGRLSSAAEQPQSLDTALLVLPPSPHQEAILPPSSRRAFSRPAAEPLTALSMKTGLTTDITDSTAQEPERNGMNEDSATGPVAQLHSRSPSAGLVRNQSSLEEEDLDLETSFVPDTDPIDGMQGLPSVADDLYAPSNVASPTREAPATAAPIQSQQSSMPDSYISSSDSESDRSEVSDADERSSPSRSSRRASRRPPSSVGQGAADIHRQAQAPKRKHYRTQPLGYRHRGAIIWTGPEIRGEFDTSGLDMFNDGSATTRKNARVFFEAHINEQIGKEEPNAPHISIFDRDGDNKAKQRGLKPSSCPPVEHFYTNRLIYRKRVPVPIKMVMCQCEDACGPTCPCYLRQQELTTMLSSDSGERPYKGFAYGPNGELRLPHPYPVWECNSDCKCPRDCPNRQVGSGRRVKLNIGNTAKKGWGIFAGQDIQKGTFLCLYSGEVLLSRFAEQRGELSDAILPPRSYIFDIDSQWLRKHNSGNKLEEEGFIVIASNQPYKSIQEAAGKKGGKSHEPSRDAEELAIYAIDARHYGNLSRYFNHSCDPNALIRSVFVDDQDTWKPLICIFSRRFISEGEEVTISYKGLHEEEVNLEHCLPASPVVVPEPQPLLRGKKRKRGRPAKDTTDADGASRQAVRARPAEHEGAAYTRCECGSHNCDGNMFPIREDDDEHDD